MPAKRACAMPVEAVRVGDRTPPQGVSFNGRALVMGAASIPLEVSPAPVLMGQSGARATRLQTGRMTIDYIGPAGSFDPVTYSLADVLQGACPGRFRGKYVLIGATAATLGDRIASPFVHQTDAHADQHGVLMPGVEVLANAMNTILRVALSTRRRALPARSSGPPSLRRSRCSSWNVRRAGWSWFARRERSSCWRRRWSSPLTWSSTAC